MPSLPELEHHINNLSSIIPQIDSQVILAKVLLRKVSDKLDERTKSIFSDYGLNWVSFMAMVILISSKDEPLNPCVLAEETCESRANVTRICDDLVKKKLLSRKVNQEDRRCIDLFLTPKGEVLVKEILLKNQSEALAPLSELSIEELNSFKITLMKLFNGLIK